MTPTPSSVARAREIVRSVNVPVSPEEDFNAHLKRVDEALIAALALALDAQRERDAKVATDLVSRILTLYGGKLPYFMYGSPTQDDHDASIADYTAKQIAKAIREGKD